MDQIGPNGIEINLIGLNGGTNVDLIGPHGNCLIFRENKIIIYSHTLCGSTTSLYKFTHMPPIT